MAEIKIQIPGYELEKLAGRGGMAEVYIARQISLGRKVALKILLQTLSPDSNFTERFEREAKTAAALQHPNIIKIFDTGMYEGRYYIAMEYLGSKTLADLIIDGMSPSLAVKYLTKLASALEYAHAKGVIHRDIKPTNVLLYPDNEPVLSDFGISRLVDSNSSLTATGMMIGSPRYMSPEQAKGATVDSRSDLYALGVVFYEMLTGTFPYDAEDTLALMYMHVHDEIPRLPHSLSRYQPVIDRLMAKQPDQRLSSAGEILPLLENTTEQVEHFSEVNETVFIQPEVANISATDSTVAYTPEITNSSTREETLNSTGSQRFSATDSKPVADNVSSEKPANGTGKGYGKYVLLAIVLISAVGLYKFLVPAVLTSPQTVAPDTIDDIVKELENKLNAGDYESAKVLLKQGLATDALDQRLLDMAESIRVGIKQQEDTLAADKLVGEKLASAREKLGAGQYKTASTLIAQARQLGADQTRIASMEGELALALEADVQHKQYAASLGKSRTALKGKDFDAAKQAAKEAMALKPEATEVKQLLIDIEELKQESFEVLAKDDLPGSKEALGKLKDYGVSAAEVDAAIANLEPRQAADMMPLTVETTPTDAKVRILNIGPAYVPGMELEAGSYKIEVSKPGYKPHVSMFELKQGQEIHMVELEIESLEATPTEQVSEQPDSESKPFIEPEMVRVPGGSFQMGCVIDRGCAHDEKPAHGVQVASFEIGKYEVTFDEWDNCVDLGGCSQRLEDQGWGRGRRPAINVNWNDAQEYTQWLSKKTGKQYRLPTEAEWEYAARAGTSGPYSFDGAITVDRANYDGNYFFDDSPKGKFREKTTPVGSFHPNPWGLYDMHGNVWEWNQDCLHENYERAPNNADAWTTNGDCTKRGMRGGSWNSAPGNLRSSKRGWFNPGRRYFIDGFRVVRTLSP